MKTLTKILSVTALIVLCVCLFTLTAFAHSDPNDCKAAAVAAGKTFPEGKASGITPTCIQAGPAGGATYYVCPDSNCDWCFDGPDPASATALGQESNIVKTDPSNHASAAIEHPAVAMDCKTNTAGRAAYKEYPCCGALTDDSDVPINSLADIAIPVTHNAGDPQATYLPPACNLDGHYAYATCQDCGQLLDAGGKVTTWAKIIIPKDSSMHVWGTPVVAKAPTDVSPGWQIYTCSVCGATKEETLPATGITPADGGQDIDYVIPIHDTWLRGEEPLTFESSLVKKLNDASGPNANYVGVRIGTDSLYENSYDTFDFWSWDEYVKLGDKTMQGLREGKYRLWIYDKRHPDQYTCSCDFWVVDVPTLEPYSTDKHVVNSSKSLRFIASEEMQPDSIMVGSRRLYDSSDYFVSNDRKNVTLSPDFLNARQTGTYTISALTKDGRTIKTNFYILSTAQASSSPRTGDESQIGLWAAFLLLSGAAIVVMVPKLRKHGAK